MTVRRLINMLAPLSQGGDTRTVRNDALAQVQRPNASALVAFFEKMVVATVLSDGQMTCEFQGGLVDVQPETDDTFAAGDEIWVSLTREGTFISHGKVTNI